jgi:hypothetical protein
MPTAIKQLDILNYVTKTSFEKKFLSHLYSLLTSRLLVINLDIFSFLRDNKKFTINLMLYKKER